MNISTWTPEMVAVLTRRAQEGRTAAEIGAELRVTRNAVLGRAHRMGIKLPMTEAKQAAMIGAGREGGKVRRKPALDAKIRASRPRGASPFSDREKVHAIAARLAGASFRRAAEEVGATLQTLRVHWMKNEALVAEARALLERAVDDAAQRRHARLAKIAEQRSFIQRHNENLLKSMGNRNADFIRRRLAGDSLAEIGRDHGLTRERIRQILMKGVAAGIKAPPGMNLMNDKAAKC